MKENIERILKEALENHSLPYSEGAWESMSKRLDGTTPSPFYRKWWFAAAIGTALVGSATYFSLQSNGDQIGTSSHSVLPSTSQEASSSNTSKTAETSTNNAVKADDTFSATTNPEAVMTIPTEVRPNIQDQKQELKETKLPVENTGVPAPTVPNTTQKYATLTVPSSLCLNESFEIFNPNPELSILVKGVNGKSTTIRPKGKMNIDASQEGTIQVISGNHIDEVQINKPNNKLYVDVDPSLLYQNGVPTIEFTVSGNDQAVNWTSNIKGNEVKNGVFFVHPYKEQMVSVTVKSTDMNGCSVEETKTVQLQSSYNLLAPTGFTPLDYDTRTNRFMPIALTQRETPFELFIYDPKNVGLVYKTNDATRGWDGIDMRTSELVTENSVWLWKVVMKNPNPGEPTEYSGTITRR